MCYYGSCTSPVGAILASEFNCVITHYQIKVGYSPN